MSGALHPNNVNKEAENQTAQTKQDEKNTQRRRKKMLKKCSRTGTEKKHTKKQHDLNKND